MTGRGLRWPSFALALALALVLAGAGGDFARAQPSEAELARRLQIDVPAVQKLRTARGLTPERLAKIPPADVPGLMRRLAFPDLPLRRAQFRAWQNQDLQSPVPIPIGAAARAASQFRNLQNRSAKTKAAGIPVGQPEMSRGPLIAGLDKDGWQWLGPGNVGGRTRALLIHPTEPETMWAGAVGGGVWRTDNGGQEWYPLDNSLSTLGVTALAMDPQDPQKLFASTGEKIAPDGYLDPRLSRGDGLFASSDGGETWSPLPATKTADFAYIRRLAFSPDGAVLLAATAAGIFRTTDRGQAWTKVQAGEIADVNFHPSDPLQAIAGGQFDAHAYVSADGGLTWQAADLAIPAKFTDLEGRVEVEYARADPTIVYASVWAGGSRVYRSTDGGKSFALRNSDTFFMGEQGYHNNALWAGDPTSADLVICGGIDVWKSTDGGQTLAAISYWRNSASVHADNHVIVAHPQYDGAENQTLFVGNDGGIFKNNDLSTAGSDDQGATGWVNLNQGYGVTLFYDLAGHPASGGIIAGAQDNGTLRFSPVVGAKEWKMTFSGDGGHCEADRTDPNIFYGEYQGLGIFRSNDGGRTADLINGERAYVPGAIRPDQRQWKPDRYVLPDAKQGRTNFIPPFVLDPNEPNRLLAGGLSLWRTNNAREKLTPNTGPLWNEIKPPTEAWPSPDKLTADEYYTAVDKVLQARCISAIAVAPGNSEVVWVGHNDGDLYRTTNGTAEKPEWKKLDSEGLPDRYCHALLIHPTDHDTVYAAFGGFARDNLWKTIDGGTTWKSIGGTFPEVAIRGLTLHPERTEYVYAGTDVGLFASEDGGETWSPANHGPANVMVEEFIWMGNRLVVATFGRGVYSIEVKLP